MVRRRAAIRGASSARGIVRIKPVSGGGDVRWVRDWTSMGGGGEDAHFGSVLERVGEMVEQVRHSIGETDRSEDTGAQKRVAAKGVEK